MQVLYADLGQPNTETHMQEQNKVADALVRYGEEEACFDQVQILTVPPLFAMELLSTDKLGTTFLGRLYFKM